MPKNLIQWSVILRLTPGVPFIFSNYGLGILGMPFIPYLIISIPILAVTACGYILAFAGIFSENWKFTWLGISLIVIIITLGKIVVGKKSDAN